MRCTGILCAVATVVNSDAKYCGGVFGYDSLSRYLFSRSVVRGTQGDANAPTRNLQNRRQTCRSTR